MSVFYYVTGILIGLALFLYIRSGIDLGKKKLLAGSESGGKSSPAPEAALTAGDITFRGLPARSPGQRMCPLCGSVLTKYEALYASRVDTSGGGRILIHGCRYCYKPEEAQGIRRRSSF